jgi:hypothetical protein
MKYDSIIAKSIHAIRIIEAAAAETKESPIHQVTRKSRKRNLFSTETPEQAQTRITNPTFA